MKSRIFLLNNFEAKLAIAATILEKKPDALKFTLW